MAGDSTLNSAIRRRRHRLRRVDVTCDKFDNQLYILKTDNRLETDYQLPF